MDIEWSGLIPLVALAIILVVGWIVVRIAFKLTATLFRLGCFIIALIVGGIFILSLLGG